MSIPVLHIVATSMPRAPIHVDIVKRVSSIVPGGNVSLATGFKIVKGTPMKINIINGVLPPRLLRLMNLICITINTRVIASDICLCLIICVYVYDGKKAEMKIEIS